MAVKPSKGHVYLDLSKVNDYGSALQITQLCFHIETLFILVAASTAEGNWSIEEGLD